MVCVLLAPARGAAAAELTLERAVTLAVERDERARIADEDLAAAEAEVARARAFFFPDVTAQGSYVVRRDPGMFQDRSVVSGSVAASITLFDGRGFPLLSAARSSRDAARLDRSEVRRQLALDAARAYLVTLGAQSVVEAARHRVDSAYQLAREPLWRWVPTLSLTGQAEASRSGTSPASGPGRDLAGPVRLRPILMTSIATGMAAVPAALALGPGGELRGPMAIAVIGGLAVATMMSLFVVPSFYVCADWVVARIARRLGRRGGPPAESAETDDRDSRAA